jgi:hypothetical protein
MKLKRPPSTGADRLEHLDATMDSYLKWRDESRAVAESYRMWSLAAGQERDAAFDRYVEAVDREEQAARGYRRVVERAHPGFDPRLPVR